MDDLDMQFIPNMELYKDDSEDDMVNEEIIRKPFKKNESKNITSKNCEVCEYPLSTNIIIKNEEFFKEYNFCKECKSHLYHLFEVKLFNLLDTQKIKTPVKKRINDLIKHLLKNSYEKESMFKKINDILDKTMSSYKESIENLIPYDNIKMLDSDGNFGGFTTIKRMNKFISENSVYVLDDKIIKWKYKKDYIRNEFHVKEDKMKENKCFCCGKTKFLKSVGIYPKKQNLSIFLRDNVLIHFFFAFCSKCRIISDKNRDICNNYFYETLGVYPNEYIEDLYLQKHNNKIMDFVEEYIQKFKELCLNK